jgi:hypothetical protein
MTANLAEIQARADDDDVLSVVLSNAQTIVDDLGSIGHSQAGGFIHRLVQEVRAQRIELAEYRERPTLTSEEARAYLDEGEMPISREAWYLALAKIQTIAKQETS